MTVILDQKCNLCGGFLSKDSDGKKFCPGCQPRTEVRPNNELGIHCPDCGARHVPEDPLFVTNTYSLATPNAIKRVRECPYCGKRFKTLEQILDDHSNTIKAEQN